MKYSLLSLLIGCTFASQAATWSDLYQLKSSDNLPTVTMKSQQRVDDQNYLVSALHLNLNDVLNNAKDHSTIVIAADTVEINRNMLFDAPNKRIFIV
ncbi:hypothetical protein H5156_13020, partial [Pseudoalteromonas sp. SG41-6]|nr:hypothetical protein [Pseudoalteromonas sp. SG41-6]